MKEEKNQLITVHTNKNKHKQKPLSLEVVSTHLRQLRGLATSGFTHDDHDVILPDQPEQLLSDGINWQILSLFLHGLFFGELRYGLRLLLEMIGELLIGFELFAITIVFVVFFLFAVLFNRERMIYKFYV